MAGALVYVSPSGAAYGGGGILVLPGGQVATPTFSPAAGSYSSAQSVTISCSTPSSSIYYTTDGSTPTFPITGTTQLYAGALNVNVTQTVQAIGAASGLTNSAVGSAAYTITSGATNIFNLTSFASGGSNPNYPSGFSGYGNSATPGTPAVFTMIATSQHDSCYLWYATAVTTGAFTAHFQFQPTNMTIAQNQCTAGLMYAIEAQVNPHPPYWAGDANGNGYCAANNQTPCPSGVGFKFDAGSLLYDVSGTSYQSGQGPSSTGLYLNHGPNISPGGSIACTPAVDMSMYGVNLHTQHVFDVTVVYDGTLATMVIRDTTTNAQARFVWPLTLSSVVGGASTAFHGLTCGQGASGNGNWNILNWRLDSGYNTRLATPTFSPSPGNYSSSQTVTISFPAGSTCYYTTNGLSPTSASTQYTGPITISANTVLQAVAIESAFTDSYVAAGNYTIGTTSNTINFPTGFAAGNLVTAGFAYYNAGTSAYRVADTTGQTVGSVWFPLPVSCTTFTVAFTVNWGSAGQGFGFVIQNAAQGNNTNSYGPGGVGAITYGGSAAGYGGINGSVGMLNSLCFFFDQFSTPNSVGLYVNGSFPTGSQVASGLTFTGAFNVTLTYLSGGTSIALTMQKTSGGTTFSRTYSIPGTVTVPTLVGANSAIYGFVAGTGGAASITEITKWTVGP